MSVDPIGKKSGRCFYFWLTGAKTFVLIGLKFPRHVLLLVESSLVNYSYLARTDFKLPRLWLLFAGKSRDVRLSGNGSKFFFSRNQHVKKGKRMSIAGVRDHCRTQGMPSSRFSLTLIIYSIFK
jgi:hypothetical protein